MAITSIGKMIKPGTYEDLTKPKPYAFGDPVGQTAPADQLPPSNSLAGIPKPKVATVDNPVVDVKPPTQTGQYYAADDLMGLDKNGLYDYVDNMSIRQMNGEKLTAQEQFKLLKAQRLIADQVAKESVANPYTDMISKEQQAKDQRANELKSEEDKLYAAEKARVDAYYNQQATGYDQAGQKESEATQRILSFAGAGRSTYAAEKQGEIQKSVEQSKLSLAAENNLQLEKYRAEMRGATRDELSQFDARINNLATANATFLGNLAVSMNQYNQENAKSYQDKINNILQLASQYAGGDLTEEETAQAASYAQLLIDKDGKINESILKTIPGRLIPEAMKQAATFKASMPEDAPTAINSDNGSFVWNPTTKKYELLAGSQKESKDEYLNVDGRLFNVTKGVWQDQEGAGGGWSNKEGMRTDRNNNPTAMTVDVAKSLGLREGVDFTQGDSFQGSGGNTLYTAKLLGDPIEVTIRALDLAADAPNKSAFYTGGGAQRRTHTAYTDEAWKAMSPEEKKNAVIQMYQKEGGNGSLAGVTPSTPQSQPTKQMSDIELPSKANEGQRLSLAFANRMKEAHETLLELGLEKTYADRTVLGQYGQEGLPKGLKSTNQKDLDLLKQSFITGVLRKESGANITDTEFARYEKQYFPEPGDSLETIKKKRKLREEAIKNMYLTVGNDKYGTPIVQLYEQAKKTTPDMPESGSNANTSAFQKLRDNL